jgi:hypothetical protein
MDAAAGESNRPEVANSSSLAHHSAPRSEQGDHET